MKKLLIVAASASLFSLAACGHETPAADNVVANAENTADVLENQGDMIEANAANAADAIKDSAANTAAALDNKADAVKATAENKADAMDKAH
ncbi:MAG: hypothetical protein JSR79_07195 [Proteobacteria bacterium]|nr:hypothetical protein [Pseudomonadota bacterium]